MSLALKIQNARNAWEVGDCLVELQALIRLAGERIEELRTQEEEVERRIAEYMPPEIKDLD